MFRHKFRGKVYKILQSSRLNGDLGICEAPTTKGKTIKFSPKLEDLKALEIFVHEALHACFWDLDEEAIDEAGRDISRLLWKLGYRQTTDVRKVLGG